MIELTVSNDTIREEVEEFNNLVNPKNIYEDVAKLQEEVEKLKALTYDSGWIDLPLLNGAVAYNTAQIPQYRKIGKQVFIRGVFKNITTPCVVAILPEGFRPSQRLILTLPRTGYVLTRFEIETNGEVKYVGSYSEIADITWFSFSDTTFLLD